MSERERYIHETSTYPKVEAVDTVTEIRNRMFSEFQFDTPEQFFYRAESVEDFVLLHDQTYKLSQGISADVYFTRKKAGKTLTANIQKLYKMIDEKKNNDLYTSMFTAIETYNHDLTTAFEERGFSTDMVAQHALIELTAFKNHISPVPDITL